MDRYRIFAAAWLLSALLPATAANAPLGADRGIQELPDAELGNLRGRYTVAGYGVAWFGVSMVSSWVTATGQSLTGTLMVGLDFYSGQPRLVLVPSVTLDMVDEEGPKEGVTRMVDASGLANITGITQAVQVAGDGNTALNGMRLTVRDATGAEQGPGAMMAGGDVNAAQSGSASVLAGMEANGARVQLRIEGQGLVEQWMRSGSIGQSIQLAGDGQRASNSMNIELVRQPLAMNAQLSQSVAQAIALARGVGR